MSAATEYKAMNEIIEAFHLFKPQAAILTKLDEAATIGSALSSLIEHNLPLSFITNGQQVPEDMRHPSARELVAQCVAELDVEDDDYEENKHFFRGWRKSHYGFEALTSDMPAVRQMVSSDTMTEKPTLEDLMFFMHKGGNHG